MRKNFLVGILLAAYLITGYSEQAVAQFGGTGAFGEVMNYLKRVTTSIVPSTTNLYDLGSSSKKFKNSYFEGSVTAGSFVSSGTTERITGNTYGEYIDFLTLGDDYIGFYGAGGSDNTMLSLDLDGTYPELSSTDLKVGIKSTDTFVASNIETSYRYTFDGATGWIWQQSAGNVDVSGDLRVRDAGETKFYKYATCHLSKGIVETDKIVVVNGWGQSLQNSVGLDGVVETDGDPEGYISFDASADFLRFAMIIPSTYVDGGNAQDLVIEFDMLETGAAECNYDVKIFEYGNLTPIITDTIVIANGASRAWVGLVTNATGIGNDTDIDADDILIIELSPTADADTANIYGARLKYRCGIQATQS